MPDAACDFAGSFEIVPRFARIVAQYYFQKSQKLEFMDFKYDVTFSFAGEDRNFVEQVASFLKKNDIKVFYDRFEETALWGKDLGVHFEYIYRKSAKYCVVFISKHYKEKLWTRYEVKNALSRAIENDEGYILPARFDDTEIDGIRPTIGYLDLRKLNPQEFGKLIVAKIKNETSNESVAQELISDNLDILLSLNHAFAISALQGFSGKSWMSLSVTIINKFREKRYFREPYFKLNKEVEGETKIFKFLDRTNIIKNIKFPITLEFGEEYSISYDIPDDFAEKFKITLNNNFSVIAVVSTTIGENFYSNEVEIDNIINNMFLFGKE
jgi:hypothetical protein